MPTPRPQKQNGGSRGGSENESDANSNLTPSAQLRRTRKRSAHAVREGSSDQSASQPSVCPHSEIGTSTSGIEMATTGESLDRLVATNTTYSDYLSGSSAFETPDQARERLALMQSTPLDGGTSSSMREGASPRPSRSMRSSLGLRLTTESASSSQSPRPTSTSTLVDLSSSQQSHTSSAPSVSSQQSEYDYPLRMMESQSTQGSSQSRPPLASISSVSMSRTSSNVSNMSPPRPTRALPRRRASARTQSRPLLSSSNSSSSSYSLRSRSFSNSNILAPSNSTANILASNQNNRQTSLAGCLPLGGGWDPNYNPPSGMSTPRTPLAEIPLWLADMRSESRRSSVSSTSFIDREEFLSASRSVSSRHARTSSTSSSGPSSPGGTRNGSTSPVVPFRRSLRSRGPRPSDENAQMSASPSYFGDYDPLPSPSISMRGDMMPLDEDLDPSAGLSSSMIHLGTSSPSTPSVHVQTSSPAMSTRSRTLNRAGSVRNRRMTNPLNTPVSVEMLPSSSESGRIRNAVAYAALQSARPTDSRERGRNEDERRTASLLERRAVAAAAASAGSTSVPQPGMRTSSRPSSRTSSPAHATRASRRRSIAVEGQYNTTTELDPSGPRPNNLEPLRIPIGPFGPEVGLMMLNVPAHPTWNGMAPSTVIPEHSIEELAAQQAGQDEPVSPSAFSEMTSLTQGSTASESMNSAGGLPATPSSSVSNLDPFAHTALHDGNIGASLPARRTRASAANIDADGDQTTDLSSDRLSRYTGVQRKAPNSSRDGSGDDDPLGVQLRPRP